MIQFAWMIPLFPLLGFVINGIGKKTISRKGSGIIASVAVFLSFAVVGALYLQVANGTLQATTLDIFNWLDVAGLKIPFSFLIDPLSVTMMLIVTGVGLLIHIYSIGYMGEDEHANTFFEYMNLFIFFMLMLVIGANFLILFIGWEGVGLCSYLLIGFWFKNNDYNYAARKAFIMNRIGDLGFLIGIILLYYQFHTVNFLEVFSQASTMHVGEPVITVITILLLIGALGKSAQIPLYTWLPDAMAGPTPVSALIHAATMVTAGIYMIARSSALFVLAPITMNIIIVIGLSTALFAAIIGLKQNDIKKVLAYSTVSQLGYMFLALGLGAFSTAVFHVTTHAFFKALLFLGAGAVIHALGGEQDIRFMGGLKKKLPITFFTFLIATLAISGIPPFSGFFSKDEILAAAWERSPLIWLVGMATALITCFYMFRLLYLVFFSTFRGTKDQENHLHESSKVMTIPLIILAVLAFAGGFLNIPALFGGHESFHNFLSPVLSKLPAADTILTTNTTEYSLIGVSVALLLLIIFIAQRYYVVNKQLPEADTTKLKGIAKLIYNKYYVDEIYDFLFVKPYNFLSVKLYSWIEKNVIDLIVNSTGALAIWIGSQSKRVQTGNTGLYLFIMVFGVIFMLLYLILSFHPTIATRL
jgi:NADH-quinone oxidoreductase subunit L